MKLTHGVYDGQQIKPTISCKLQIVNRKDSGISNENPTINQ